jgi:hypothetical protein
VGDLNAEVTGQLMFRSYRSSQMALEAAKWQENQYPIGSKGYTYWKEVGREIARLSSVREREKLDV